MQISITNELAQYTLRRIFTNFDPNTQLANYFSMSTEWDSNISNPTYIQPETTFAQIAGDQAGLGGSNVANLNYASLRLMKGTVPTDFSGLTAYTSRSADVLVTWPVSLLTGWTYSDNTITGGNTNLVQASQSGVATWLWWSNSVNSSDLLNYGHQIVFTVGGQGSGSDFELLNTTIVSGNQYRIINGPRFSLATEYNY